MTDKLNINTPQVTSEVTSVVLAQSTETELTDLTESVEKLREVLRRFIPLLDSDSIEIVLLAHNAVKTIYDEVASVLVSIHTQNSLAQVQSWDDEGGNLGYAPG